jgi:hypothetical protein
MTWDLFDFVCTYYVSGTRDLEINVDTFFTLKRAYILECNNKQR